MVSRIALMDQSSALASAGVPPAWRRFHAARQRAEQNRACSRRGAKGAPHCSQFRVSAITLIVRTATDSAGAADQNYRVCV